MANVAESHFMQLGLLNSIARQRDGPLSIERSELEGKVSRCSQTNVIVNSRYPRCASTVSQPPHPNEPRQTEVKVVNQSTVGRVSKISRTLSLRTYIELPLIKGWTNRCQWSKFLL